MTFNILSIEEIMHEYERTRLDNKRKLQERRTKIYQEIPRIDEIDSTITTNYLSAARLKIKGDSESRKEAKRLSDASKELTSEKHSLLEQSGYPSNYLEPIYNCPLCQDDGFINGRKCSCFMDRIVNALYLQSNLKNILDKENFSTFSFDYYSNEIPSGKEYSPYDNIKNVVSRSKDFISNFETKPDSRGNLLIYGETGLGKTFLTNCIAKELLDNGHSVLYLSANELFESVLAEYLMNRKSELEELYKYIYNSELLIIDDLGTELTNNFVLSQLFEIINKREAALRSTLISTNLTMKQLRDRYSERIMSRLIANYTVFNIYGDNIRYQKRKKAINSNI